MLVLAKAAMAMMLGFILSIVAGLILIPLFKRIKAGQNVSTTIGERHMKKNGTPTLGGLIFIIPTIVTLLLLKFKGSIDISYNLLIVMIVFVAYAALGFADDWLKIRYHNNKGLSILFKLACQMAIALVFFYIYITNGGSPVVEVSAIGLRLDLGWLYGIFILFLLVGSSNAVNITDGLDGLAGGLSAIAFLAYGLLAWNASWMQGAQEVGIFCFVLVGTLLGFLIFNTHPAKVFMGDTGSLALGGALAAIAILTKHELLLAVVGGVFVVETLSSAIQMIAIIKFKRKILRMAPLHHHFEQCGWEERDIVKLFYVVGLLLAMAAITYGVWL
ncbi:MAG: phospho-N-acetylmuramoyl-pentapeptide-transferase [Firmicutes bacterium]|nr:phospho-N-acetylmuramoyl-pentapeptide-transferase [Bacillota bacterium]